MSKVIIKLKHIKFSPWGLFREVSTPFGDIIAEPLLWVTEVSPVDEIEKSALGEAEIQKIISGHLQEKIEILGGIEIDKPQEELPSEVPPPSPPPVLSREQLIMDVSSIIEKEKEVKERFESLSLRRPTQIEEFMSQKAHLVKKELKKAAKTGASLRFFKECRDYEEAHSNRKTVLSLLVEIIQRKVAIIGVDKVIDRQSGHTVLDDSYFDLIEEEEEPDDEEDF